MFQIFFKTKQSFEGMFPDERVILLSRRHKIFFYLQIFFFLLLGLLSFIAVIIMNPNEKILDFILFLVSVFISILWLILFVNLMMYSLTTFIVTNKRVIKIEELGLFNYEINELPLSKIQDVSANISGILGNFLNFGDITIQTAGTEGKFVVPYLPKPLKIKNEILNVIKNSQGNAL
jgi:membrane protein YdbS with pleckstrin-like domain